MMIIERRFINYVVHAASTEGLWLTYDEAIVVFVKALSQLFPTERENISHDRRIPDRDSKLGLPELEASDSNK